MGKAFCAILLIFILNWPFDFRAQEPVILISKPLFPSDPKGLNLPPGEPRAVDTNGNVTWVDEDYTTRQYQHAALNRIIQEANDVANELQLTENLPITESNIVQAFVDPFGFAYVQQMIGNISTTNYTYSLSIGNKFSFLDDMHQNEEWNNYKKSFTWPISRMDTNEAYQLATQWLAAISMDVKGLNRDCQLFVEPDPSFQSPPGKFVPVYFVDWKRPDLQMGATAQVRVFTPTKRLLGLRVEDPRYILRKPVTFNNLDSLLPGPTPILGTNYPSRITPITIPQ